MAFKTENVQIDIDVSTQKAVREIAKLQHGFQDISPKVDAARKAVDKASAALEKFSKADRVPSNEKWKKAYDNYYNADKAYRDLKKTADTYTAAIDRQVKELGVAALTNKELNRYYNEQKRLLDNAIRGTEAYEKALTNLNKAQNERMTRRNDVAPTQSLSQQLKGGLMPALIGGVAGGAVAMAGEILGNVLGSIGDKVEKIISKSDKMTDLANAIHGTTEEANQLNSAIGKLDTRIDMKTRRDIATEAGKLDVPTNQIVAYTEAMSEAVLVMESDFPDGAGKMTEVFTKIKGLYKDTKDLDYPTSVKNIGSALKGLADDGTATAKWSSEFLLRLGALDEGVRPTVTQVLGLGAALEESGLTDEIAASGVQNVLSKAYRNTEGFAKFFGQSKKDFEAFINLNPNEFLFKFAERLKPLSSTQKMQALQALGVESQEAAKVLGVLVNKTDEVAEKQAKANSFFIEGTRLTELYATKNDNLAGRVERAGNKIAAFFSNSKMADWLSSFVGQIADAASDIFNITTKTEELSQKFREQEGAVKKLEQSVSPLLDRYDELYRKSNRSQVEQKELNNIITTLSGVLPQTAIQFGKYGDAIGISTDKARDFIKVQKAMMKAQNAQLISSLENDLKSTAEKMKTLERYSTGKTISDKGGNQYFQQSNTGFSAGIKNGFSDIFSEFSGPLLNPEQYGRLQKTLSSTKTQFLELQDAIRGLKGENIEIPKVNAPTTKPPVDFNPDELSKGEKGKSKAQLEAEKLAEDRIQAEAKTNAEILKLRVEQITNENDKKEAQIRLQYSEEVNAQKQLVTERKLSQATFDTWIVERNRVVDKELAENKKDANEKAIEAAKKVNLKIAKDRLSDEKDTLSKKLKIATKAENLEEQLAIEGQMLMIEKEIALLEGGEERKAEILKKYEDDKLLLKEKYAILGAQKQAEAAKKAEDAQKKVYEDIGKGINAVSQLTGEFFNFQKQAIDNQQIREDNRYNKQIANLESQKEKSLITEDEYNTKKAEIDKVHNAKTAAIKKKAFEADKQARIAQIIMSTGQAVMSALATGGIFGVPASILAGVTGAAQLALALSQETPDFEAYEKGDFTDNPKQYANKKPTSSAKLAWVNEKGPEFITNNDGVNSPDFPIMLPLLRKMNMGQAIFPDLRKMFMPNVQGFATGDFTAKPQSSSNYSSNSVGQTILPSNFDERMLVAIETFNENCKNGTFAKVMFSHKNADDFNELLTKNIEVRRRASATKNGNITDI